MVNNSNLLLIIDCLISELLSNVEDEEEFKKIKEFRNSLNEILIMDISLTNKNNKRKE